MRQERHPATRRQRARVVIEAFWHLSVGISVAYQEDFHSGSVHTFTPMRGLLIGLMAISWFGCPQQVVAPPTAATAVAPVEATVSAEDDVVRWLRYVERLQRLDAGAAGAARAWLHRRARLDESLSLETLTRVETAAAWLATQRNTPSLTASETWASIEQALREVEEGDGGLTPPSADSGSPRQRPDGGDSLHDAVLDRADDVIRAWRWLAPGVASTPNPSP